MAVALAAWLWGAPFAGAASFDCGKARSVTEKLICSDEELGRLDEELGKAFAAAVKQVRDGKALRKAQSTWLRKQREACKDAACVRARMQERVAELWATAKPLGRTGSYATGDGVLEVLELPGEILRFALEVTVITQSGEPHLGQLCGEVVLRKGRGIYRSASSTEAEPDCVLEITARKDSLQIVEREHCSAFSDQVTADGRFRRSDRKPPLLALCQEYGLHH